MLNVKEVELFLTGMKAKCRKKGDAIVCSLSGLKTDMPTNKKKR